MTEEQYIKRLPFLITWQAEARAMLVEGLNQLDGMAISGEPDEIIDAVGVVMLGLGGPLAWYLPRAKALQNAAAEADFPPEVLDVLRKPAAPETLQALVLGPGGLRILLEMPGRMIRVSEPVGGEGN